MEVRESEALKQQNDNFDNDIDDVEDDMKLLDLKQRLSLVKPKLEIENNVCRSCSSEQGCVSIYEQVDCDGLDLAHKLRVIGGIEVRTFI